MKMKYLKTIFLVIVFISSVSCIGDGVLRVKGNIVDINNNAVNNCVLELCLAEDGKILRSMSIEEEFDVAITVNPLTDNYYFVVRCNEDMYIHTTDIYEVNGKEYANKPLNIGKIVLRKGYPLKYISSCEMDFNADNRVDIALLVETLEEGRQLIVLLKTKTGYETHVVAKDMKNMYLSCHFGKSIKETTAGRSKGRFFETPGTYIELIQPESSTVAYFWNGKDFTEVWTSD